MAGRRVKVSVNLTEEDVDTLKKLTKGKKTVTETLRQSIATENFLSEEVDKGSKILIEDKDGSVRQIVFR